MKKEFMMFIRKVENGYLVEDTANSKINVFGGPVEMFSFVQGELQKHIADHNEKVEEQIDLPLE